ncbi:tRNA (cytidine(34)-2'-O)-methyltransferase [Bengtsoniella intestinalis]|uniref:tRNA (cytidine(34)-2'-O)-methyltransferase n=1 Tax=Bengtsoniella intestinalis TaxID=3073143 RepID=UPI00391EE7E8
MINIVLLEPEIPQNCGNIGRTCVATGSALHLIHPMGFSISAKEVKRAGLDYWSHLNVTEYENLEDFFSRNPQAQENAWLATTKAPHSYQEVAYQDDCYIFFGKESAGLPEDFRIANYHRCVRLPMHPEYRSLNLSNAVAVFTYEALRQTGFQGLKGTGEMAE